MEQQYDVFLSHANVDKLDFVNELKDSFNKLGIKVFYDSDSIEWGDKWKDRIQQGLDNCRFGVIVISENFFGREWTEKELKALLSRQNKSGQKLILPILYNVSIGSIYTKYKKLSDIQFLDSSEFDIKDITIKLARILLAEHNGLSDSQNNNEIFDTFFEGSDYDLNCWFDMLIKSNNQWCEYCYDNLSIGWHILEIDGKFVPFIQQTDKNGCIMYRVNPIYYDDFCIYFDTVIRPQL